MIEIRKIEQNDLKALSLLFEELTGEKTDFDEMIKNFEWINDNKNYTLLGAMIDGNLAGSVMGIICRDLVGSCRPFMVIENVIVSHKLRGRGIGKELMKEIETIGRNSNCYYTMFVSGAKRIDAHKFYETIGYRLDEVQGFKKYL